MIKINKKIEYSLMILKHIHNAKKGQFISAREICDQYKAPVDTVAKVMQKLGKQEILVSQQGTNGGYKLNVDLRNISYAHLAQVVEGGARAKDCIELKCSLFSTCNIISPIRKLNYELNSFIENISLADLFEDTPNSKIKQGSTIL